MASLKVILPIQSDAFTAQPYDGGFLRWADFIKALELALLPVSTQLQHLNFAEDYVFNSTNAIAISFWQDVYKYGSLWNPVHY